MENELKVERYDASEAAAKKKKILKKVTTGVGAAALVTVLGYYGLAQDRKGTEPMTVKDGSDTVPVIVKKDLDTVLVKEDLDTIPMTVKKDTVPVPVKKNVDTVVPMRTFYIGGNGAWFNSVIEFLG